MFAFYGRLYTVFDLVLWCLISPPLILDSLIPIRQKNSLLKQTVPYFLHFQILSVEKQKERIEKTLNGQREYYVLICIQSVKKSQRFSPLRFFYIWLRYGFCHSVIFMSDILTVVCSLVFLFPAIQNRRHRLQAHILLRECRYFKNCPTAYHVVCFLTFRHSLRFLYDRKAHTTTIYTNIHKTERKGDKQHTTQYRTF